MIALTAIVTGKFKGFDKKLVFLRRDQLQKMGIDFRKSCSRLASAFPFQELGRHAGDYPTNVFGYIAINGQESGVSKGEMLVTLLKDAATAQHVREHPSSMKMKIRRSLYPKSSFSWMTAKSMWRRPKPPSRPTTPPFTTLAFTTKALIITLPKIYPKTISGRFGKKRLLRPKSF